MLVVLSVRLAFDGHVDIIAEKICWRVFDDVRFEQRRSVRNAQRRREFVSTPRDSTDSRRTCAGIGREFAVAWCVAGRRTGTARSADWRVADVVVSLASGDERRWMQLVVLGRIVLWDYLNAWNADGRGRSWNSAVRCKLCLKKAPTCTPSVTLANLNRFANFLHCWKAYEICYKTHMTLLNSP